VLADQPPTFTPVAVDALHSGIRQGYNETQRSGGEIVMRRVEDRYQSGLVNVQWIGECPACSAHTRVAGEALARQWETAHAQYGCGHRLVRDETGRGWMSDQFATPGGQGR